MPATFTSPQVQQLRRLLARRRERRAVSQVVVEGPTLVREAVAAGWVGDRQFVPGSEPGAAIGGAGEIIEIADDVLERLGSTQQPQPPVAVFEIPAVDATVLDGATFVVVLDRIADPGNLGTALRSAEAAGVDAVVLTPGSVDPYNPKAVRASAGALFHVPVLEAPLEQVRAAGLDLVGTTSHDRRDRAPEAHTEIDLTGPIAIVMGNEASGLADEWDRTTGPIDRWVTIPHRGRAESLNLAMAATVLVFEAARQRRD